MKTTRNDHGQNKSTGPRIRESYENITNAADRINRKRMKKIDVTKDEEAFILGLIRTAGYYAFQKVMYRIQEDVVNSLIEMGILNVAGYYGGKVFFRRNYYSIINFAKVLRRVVSKLSPVEMQELDCRSVGSDDLVKVSASNCRAILKIADDNFEVTLQERRELRALLANMRWLEEPVKKEEKAEKAPEPPAPEEKNRSVSKTVVLSENQHNGTINS